MNINRNNYEEYFLLYADNELPAAERDAVKMFVRENPDLEEEFIMLQQSVVKPDTSITLENKNYLLKEEGFIDHSNYEEKFLLYTDNELNLSEIELTEKFVLANPALEKEFNVFRKVILEADTAIVFPDKNRLYKKEEGTKVIPFRWKALAAAVLLGIGLWTGIAYLQKNKPEKEMVTRDTKTIKTPVKPAEQKEKENDLVKTIDKKDQPMPVVDQKEFEKAVKQPQQNVVVKNIPAPVNNIEVKNNNELKKEDVAVVDPVKTEVIKTNDLPEPLKKPTEPNDQNVDKANNIQTNPYAQQASYIEDASVKSENYVFYNITAEEFRKSKIGNFLKKVKRTIERKNPLKNNSLKIGNVEIAKDEQN